uniref:ubiquitinyl hydrolase 1 n=1 Tax=Denticeps clupeoides TaxID=299321 RepID=A0AAY4A2E7_9TELE
MQKALKKYFVNMDEYLASIGLYRKMVARDASCLFRAVSEQLYHSQSYHQNIRRACVDFMRRNKCNFEPFVESSFEKYLERLEDPKETAGQVVIKALSLLYRYIMLCCSNNGHYDIVYPRCYQVDAAICQSLLYDVLYVRVLAIEEDKLQSAMEVFRCGGRRYRNSISACSEDAGYDTPEERRSSSPHLEDWDMTEQKSAEDKVKQGTEESKALEGPVKLTLPYKVLKALDPDVYRNVEFDVWHESHKELQKTEYMVFAGRQYYLGDKCQVRLDPKGKYYNAFIQEVGTHASAVTVFIEELGEKHLVSPTNLKPVNPVPAWNITPNHKGGTYGRSEQYPGELDVDVRGRRRFFKKTRGKEVLMTVSYSPPPGGLAYEHYRPHPVPRPPRGYGPPSSARFLNRHHLIGPEVAYYPGPGKRCYQSYDNYTFRSRRSRRSLNKECQFSFVPDGAEETQDTESTITFYEIEEGDENAFPPLPGQAVSGPMVRGEPTYWVPSGPSPIPTSRKPGMASSEDDVDDCSTAGEQGRGFSLTLYAGFQNPSVYAAAESSANLTIQEGGSRAGSPQEGVATYSYSQQVVVKSAVISPSQPVNSAPATIFTSNSSSSSGSFQTPPTSGPSPIVSTSFPPAPWFVNELGEPVAMAPPPPYSYDPNGSDLPRDCKVLQYYFNLGVQCYHQSYWHSMAQMQQVYNPPGSDSQYPPYPGTAPVPDHTVPQVYPEPGRSAPDNQAEVPANGNTLSMEATLTAPPGTVFYPVVQEPCSQPLLHPTYEQYVPLLPTTYHYLTPWTPGQPRVHTPFCPPTAHHVGYVTTPTHYVPPSM